MSYLVLARKYRPATFSEVVGQEHVTRTLANAFAANRVHHAFLFCGPRGCGKTTVARIVGKALNCEQPAQGAEPCGTCSACTSIGNGSAIDYQEMDGASNRGIDAIRELTEAVRYQPAVLKKKVYVIDEVHMLTTEAFNALLKTLEEPPPHVTFVLATTEPHKLPNTILSRCQRYDFKLVPASRLAVHLNSVFEREQLAVEPGAVSLLVRESGGSVRDALSLCDQLISYVGAATITEKHVAEVLGVADRSLTRTLVRALAAGEAGEALGAVESAIERGVDEVQLARAIVRYLRDLSVLQVAPNRPELIDAADEERTELLGEAKALDRSRVAQMFERMLRCCDELGKTLQPRLVLDCALIDVATVAPLLPLGDLLERLGELESRLIRSGARSDARPPQRAPAPRSQDHYAGGGAAPAKPSMTGLLDAALEEDRPARKPAPSFATGTAPGARPAAQPSAPASRPEPSASGSKAPVKPEPGKAPQRGRGPDLAVGSANGVGDPNAEVASAIAAAKAAKAAADAARTGGVDPRHVPHAVASAVTASAAAAPELRAPAPAGMEIDRRDPIPHAADTRAARPASAAPIVVDAAALMTPSPSGPVPAPASTANGSGPTTEQLTAAPADVLHAWNTVLGELETRRKFTLLGPFQHARVMKWSADLIELGFPLDVHSMGEMASEQKQLDELRAIIRELGSELAHVKVAVRMLDAAESAKGGVRSSLEDSRAKSTAERTKREAEAREHPITKHVLQTFGAQIKEIKTDV
jgi:DNA polymerase III subunit gamma/tau